MGGSPCATPGWQKDVRMSLVRHTSIVYPYCLAPPRTPPPAPPHPLILRTWTTYEQTRTCRERQRDTRARHASPLPCHPRGKTREGRIHDPPVRVEGFYVGACLSTEYARPRLAVWAALRGPEHVVSQELAGQSAKGPCGMGQ